jgi:hypothetical protein
MVRVLIAALAGCAAVGCLRSASPDVGSDRTVDTGVPVVLGAADGPKVEWDFGDGALEAAPRVSHVFVRAGRYRVRALEGSEERAAVTLEVIQRPITHAIPETADGALYLGRIRGGLEPAIDFAEKLLGPDPVQRFIETAVLPSVALDDASVEPEGGIGLFTLSGFRGLAGLLAARDPSALSRAVEHRFEKTGAGLSQNVDGSVRIQGPQGAEMALLADRGYVYLIVPQPGAAGAEGSVDPAVAVKAIRESRAAGLEGSGRAKWDGVAPGLASVFLQVVGGREGRVRSLVASFSLADLTARMDGALWAEGPLWKLEGASAPPLVGAAPASPVAAASISASPRELTAAALSLLTEPAREAALARWGMQPADLAQIADALSGTAALLVYFDAPGFFSHLAQKDARPEPKGAVLGSAGLAHAEGLDELLQARLRAAGVTFQRELADGRPRFRISPPGLPSAELKLGARELSLRAGESLASRQVKDVAAEMRARFGVDTFGPGHVSAVLDVGELARELEAPIAIPGLSAQRLSLLQGFSVEFLHQLTPIDTAFVDLVATPDGARAKGSLTLRRR